MSTQYKYILLTLLECIFHQFAFIKIFMVLFSLRWNQIIYASLNYLQIFVFLCRFSTNFHSSWLQIEINDEFSIYGWVRRFLVQLPTFLWGKIRRKLPQNAVNCIIENMGIIYKATCSVRAASERNPKSWINLDFLGSLWKP